MLSAIDFTSATKLVTINNFAFRFCSSLVSLIFPKSLKELGYYGTFEYCYQLSNVSFPDESSLEIIYGGTFSHTKLTTFRIPSKVKTIYGESFAGTPIREFTIQDGNTYYDVYNGSIYTKDFSQLICHQKATEFNIHSSTKIITNLAFSGYKFNITVPNTVTTF